MPRGVVVDTIIIIIGGYDSYFLVRYGPGGKARLGQRDEKEEEQGQEVTEIPKHNFILGLEPLGS